MSMPRASALSSHAALWSALADDRSDGMFATGDVYSSKLPSHTNLPSRFSPCNRTSNGPSDRFRRDSVFKGPSGFRSRLRSIDFDPSTDSWPIRNRRDTGREKDRVTVNITHSAILESEDEEGYRLFIGQVAGGVPGPNTPPAQYAEQQGGGRVYGAGLGLGTDLEMQAPWSYRSVSSGLGLGTPME